MFKGKYINSISHDIMVNDSYRMSLYFKAIENKVTKGDTVIDFGAGTGVLGIIAAHFGAKKVYAIEEDLIVAEQLKHNIKINNMQDIIEVYVGTSQSFLKEKSNLKVDLIISECIGDHLFESRMLYDFLDFVKRYNVPKQIPEQFELKAYGNYIVPKQKDLDFCVQAPVKLEILKSLLPNDLLDTAYFVGGDDTTEFYYELSQSESDHTLFKFKTIDDLDLYDNAYIKSVVDFKTKPSINDNAMLYFNATLDKDYVMTNHPNRPFTGSHSYYQRIVNLQEISSSKIEFKINVLENTSGLEDKPFPNITVKDCNE